MDRPTSLVRKVKAKLKWLSIVADIVTYEVTCDSEDLLSVECDRWIAKHPIMARAGIIAVGVILTAHLANIVPQPERYDVMAKTFWA